jgi:hypothetical protein
VLADQLSDAKLLCGSFVAHLWLGIVEDQLGLVFALD